MNHSESLPLLTDALTAVDRWAAPLAGREVKLTSDGLSIGVETDPDVDGWSGVADTATADFGALLMTLLRTGAVKYLQQTLRTAITFIEAGHTNDPAVHLGERTAREVLTIARSLDPEEERRRQMMKDTTSAANLRFERFLDTERPSMPDIDSNFVREDRDALRESMTGREGQPEK